MKPILFIALAATSVWAQSPTINESPSRQFGQLRLTAQDIQSSANLVEGRELNNPETLAFDTSVTPPILYVADTGNNRVLAWRDPNSRSPGDTADRVIGQRDLFSTRPLGPGTTLSTGLAAPTGLAVNARGDLYVADAGNNRILRFPQPFRQTGDLLIPDMVIGQRNFNGAATNEGSPIPSEKTLAASQFGTVYTMRLAFDSAGNLWATDPVNNRVLRFPVAALNAGTLEPAADTVLGQSNFTTGTIPPDPQDQPYFRNKNVLERPSGLAFDQQNRLYVTDGRSRAVLFNVLATGVPAARVLGVPPDQQAGQQPRVFPNNYNVGSFNPQGNGKTGEAESVFLFGNSPFVIDTGDHRIMRFGTPEQWGTEAITALSPPAASLAGQSDFAAGKVNRGLKEPDGTTLSFPSYAQFLGNDLWIVDSGNNRIISMPMSGAFVFGNANHLLGQIGYNYSSPNLVEGRELSVGIGGGIVIDRNSNPPRLYIADTNNNRILGFADARKVGSDPRTIATQKADVVIGQPDLFHTILNYPNGDRDQPSDTGLFGPTGLAVDDRGNLYVADFGNGRVLRFPAPFSQAPGAQQRANLVLGQFSFTAPPVKDAGISNLSAPFGLAILTNGSLAVSDAVHNRVMIFRRPSGGDFTNYQNAQTVLGQADFSSSIVGNGNGQMRSPRHIALDSSDRLYVADTGNNRMLVFTTVASTVNGAASAFQYSNGLNQPIGVAVSQNTGEIWIANTNSNTVLRLPEFQQLQFNPNVQPTQVGAGLPLALAIDSGDNLIVTEGINRITFFFAKLVSQNAANFNSKPLAPGQLAYLYRLGKPFFLTTGDGTSQAPWPTTLADLQLSVNGIPAPIFRVNQERIDFQVPMSAPSNGRADFVVTRVSTGEILAAVNQDMAPANPGFFTLNASGFGQAAATNEDGTINGPQNPVGRGKIITFYLTGQGFVNNAPPDGRAPTTAISTSGKPTMFSNNGPGRIADADILYSGLTSFPGGWQINMRVAEAFPPANNNLIFLTFNDVPSNAGPTGTIAVIFATK